MRSLLLFFVLTCALQGFAQPSFQEIYTAHPNVPSGLLEAVAWTNTRMVHLQNQQESCSGYPSAYGILGLHDQGMGYFRENGNFVAQLSGISVSSQKSDPNVQLEAYALAFENLAANYAPTPAYNPSVIRNVLHELSEIPDSGIVNHLARDMQVYEVLKFMKDPAKASQYGFVAYHFNLETVFGSSNFAVLSADRIQIGESSITDGQGASFQVNTASSTQYGPAIWNPAATCNYSSRAGTAVSAITIHTIQGSYAGAISWAQNCASSVSYHYVVRSSDGQITQMVLEEDKAWHVGSENPYTIGYEHEGYVDDPQWYTQALYQASADLSRDITNSGYGIPPLRTYFGPASVGTNLLGGCTKIKGHQHFPNQTHTDPGIYWDWEKYYRLINNNPSITTITSLSGNLTDSGGSGNYSDDERLLWLIEPTNVSSVTLNFASFDIELNWDYLFVYDGNTLDAPLLGQYSGTNSPGTVVSSGGSILLEFRSDCSTTAPGWEINFSSTPIFVDVNPPSTVVIPSSQWHTTDFTVDYTDTDLESGVKDRFYLVAEKTATANSPQSNGAFGFANETFEDNASNWFNVTGTYNLTGNVFAFSDINESNSNTYYSVDQQANGSYLYEWKQEITSSATNQRAGLHFFCDDPSQSNRGNSYFVYLRANDDQVQIYSVTNNVFNLEVNAPWTVDENVEYLCRVIYSPATGWIHTFVNGVLVAAWQDPNPLTSGNAISLRTGGCSANFDGVRVYKSRGSSTQISAGFNQEMSIESENAIPTGFVLSVITDSLDNWSPVSEESFLLDFSTPEIAYLNDGTSTDIDTFFTATMNANWEALDIHSGIANYEVAVGTLPNLDDVMPWTANGTSGILTHVLANPIFDQIYYVSLRATNNAGLMEFVTSNGQRYWSDLGLGDQQLSQLILYPNPASQSFAVNGLHTPVSVFIYDLSGKLCLEGELENGSKFPITSLASGHYRVVLSTQNQLVVRELEVIQ